MTAAAIAGIALWTTGAAIWLAVAVLLIRERRGR
jgi:hypothetical protein